MEIFNHTLTDSDQWFVKKGRIDSLSRSPFSVGDDIIVCSNKHVMLLEFYEGACPSCNSHTTVLFSYANVEHGHKLTQADCWFIAKHPTDRLSKKKFTIGDSVVICENKHMTMITSYDGKCPTCQSEILCPIPIRKEIFAWFFPMEKAKILLPKVNTVLEWVLWLLAISVIFLITAGILPNGQFVEYMQTIGLLKTRLIFVRLSDFMISDEFNVSFHNVGSYVLARSMVLFTNIWTTVLSFTAASINNYFKESGIKIIEQHEILFSNILTTMIVLLNNLRDIYISIYVKSEMACIRTIELVELICKRIKALVDMVFG